MTVPRRVVRYSAEGRRAVWEDVTLVLLAWVLDGMPAPGCYQLALTRRAVARVLEREHIAADGSHIWEPWGSED